MKVAITTWNGRVSPVLDVARQVVLVNIHDGREVGRLEASLPGSDLQAQVAALVALGADVLICGAISRPMASALSLAGLRPIPFTAGTVEDVLAAWQSGNLLNPAFTMPGCCGRMRRFRGVWSGGRHRRQGHEPDEPLPPREAQDAKGKGEKR